MLNKKAYWIWFSSVFAHAPSLFWKIYRDFTLKYDTDHIYDYISDFIEQNKSSLCDSFSLNQADEILSYCQSTNIHIIIIEDQIYPDRLKNIACPPIVLYAFGNSSYLNSQHSIAVVGARHANDYSKKVCGHFCSHLSQKGISIVSGFANGIDHTAHKSCIEAGGNTIAVLGSGIMYDYPSGTLEFKKIIAQNGVVISEYPPLEKPVPANFPVRNRLISALSDAVLVIEAGEKSGSLNTVSHGLEQGKDIFVIPPADIFSRRYIGQSELLNDGAIAVCSPDSIIDML